MDGLAGEIDKAQTTAHKEVHAGGKWRTINLFLDAERIDTGVYAYTRGCEDDCTGERDKPMQKQKSSRKCTYSAARTVESVSAGVCTCR